MAQSMLFNIPKRDMTKESERKEQTFSNTIVISSGQNLSKVAGIVQAAKQKLLNKKVPNLELVMDEGRFKDFMYNYRQNGIGAIDTETEGLNPINDKIAGVCLYTPGEKGIYVPINHIDYITGAKIKNQIDSKLVTEELQKIRKAETKDVYHNAKFDIRIFRWQMGTYKELDMIPYWDTMIAGHMLNENEAHGLKYLHQQYCEQDLGMTELDTYSKLFKGITFTLIPPEIAYLYAAYDPIMTYELYEFQKQFLDGGQISREHDLHETGKLFMEVEMPLINVVADMEDEGVDIDIEYAKKLSEKYHRQLDAIQADINKELKKLEPQIREFGRVDSVSFAKLENPINIGSPVQLAILLYDILKLQSNDKKKPRGTGEEIIRDMKHPICKLILKWRGVNKLLTTYIDKMPNEVNKKTGKVHAGFHQTGTVTGRFSSSDPNLENIPSHNEDIRKMFVAREGWVLTSHDFKQQEPRTTAHVSGDENMINAYLTGKDIYATIASIAFNEAYEDCLEFHADGSEYPEGKGRRSKAKVIVLALTYGMSDQGLADGMNLSLQEAQKVMDSFFEGFPRVKKAVDENLLRAKETGFVQTVWGRKRRLLDLLLPPFEITSLHGEDLSKSVELQWLSKIQKAFGRNKQRVIQDASMAGIRIIDNTNKISKAERQSFNSVIQGSAADITKKAMLLISRNEELKQLGYKMLIPVHDEIIGTCPLENAKRCRDLVDQCMVAAPSDKIKIPFATDKEVTRCWYGEEVEL